MNLGILGRLAKINGYTTLKELQERKRETDNKDVVKKLDGYIRELQDKLK